MVEKIDKQKLVNVFFEKPRSRKPTHFIACASFCMMSGPQVHAIK